MTIVDKVQQLKSMSSSLRVEMKDTYTSKGVVIPVGTLPTLNEMPAITQRIPQLDFEFFFNFDDVDQFGTPWYPKRGKVTGGITYAPSLTVESLNLKEFAFTESPFPATYAPSVDDPNAYPQS